MARNWSNRLRGISTFIRSADTRSFSKAALELGITPQAVSAQIKQLEEQIGVGLFRRTTRRISLTEEGASFYERCCVAVEAIDEGVRNLQDAAESASGMVRILSPLLHKPDLHSTDPDQVSETVPARIDRDDRPE